MKPWGIKKKTELDGLRSSLRWRQLREGLLTAHPLCVVCGCLGRRFPATEIHHIVPAVEMLRRMGDDGFFYEPNLVALCRRCHDRNENAYRDGVDMIVFPIKERGFGHE